VLKDDVVRGEVQRAFEAQPSFRIQHSVDLKNQHDYWLLDKNWETAYFGNPDRIHGPFECFDVFTP
jgi:hypothetical protein